MSDVAGLFENVLRVIVCFAFFRFRADQLRVSGNGGQRILEFVSDARGELAKSGEVFLELHLLLQRGQFGQIGDQADSPVDFSFAAANRRDGRSEAAAFATGRGMLHLFAPENRSILKTPCHQRGQLGILAERLTVASKAQRANPQHLCRRRVGAGNNASGIHHQQPGRHITRHFFAEPLGLLRAIFFDAVQAR